MFFTLMVFPVNVHQCLLVCLRSEVDRCGKVPGVHDPAVLDWRRRHGKDAQQRLNRPNTLLTTHTNTLTHNIATYLV